MPAAGQYLHASFFFFFTPLSAQSGPVLPLRARFPGPSDWGKEKERTSAGGCWCGGGCERKGRGWIDSGGHVIYSQAGDTTNPAPLPGALR